MVTTGEALRYYKQKHIQNALLEQAQDKEIVGSYDGKGYAKRPDILQYPDDVLALVKNGVTSFHVSEEIWLNPLQLDPMMPKQQQNALRKGWDLVLDIDCKKWEYSQIAAYYLVEAIKFSGIESVSIKFSGNHGFHIGVPFEAFPDEINKKTTKSLFPEAARTIAEYLRDLTRNHLKRKLLEIYNEQEIAESIGKTLNEIKTNGEFDPFKVLDIDTILISPRHLYRMAYSFNEKSGLISIPIDIAKILEFTLEQAKPENVIVKKCKFLDRSNAKKDEARQLFIQAYDHKPHLDEKKENRKKYFDDLENQEAIPETFFPHCIKTILQGMHDGKKRALFILVNFLRSVGWNQEQIIERIYEWNKINPEPLREVYLKGQLKFDKPVILPPNCHNEMYYKDLGINCEERKCNTSKNPAAAAKRAVFFLKQEEKPKREALTEQQKEMRRRFRKQKEDTSSDDLTN